MDHQEVISHYVDFHLNKALRISFPLYFLPTALFFGHNFYFCHSFIFGHSFYFCYCFIFCHSFSFGHICIFCPQWHSLFYSDTAYFWSQPILATTLVFATAVFSVHNDTALFLATAFIFTTAVFLATMTQLYFGHSRVSFFRHSFIFGNNFLLYSLPSALFLATGCYFRHSFSFILVTAFFSPQLYFWPQFPAIFSALSFIFGHRLLFLP